MKYSIFGLYISALVLFPALAFGQAPPKPDAEGVKMTLNDAMTALGALNVLGTGTYQDAVADGSTKKQITERYDFGLGLMRDMARDQFVLTEAQRERQVAVNSKIAAAYKGAEKMTDGAAARVNAEVAIDDQTKAYYRIVLLSRKELTADLKKNPIPAGFLAALEPILKD